MTRILVTGHAGLAGSAISTALTQAGYDVMGRRAAELDLRDSVATDAFFVAERPDAVVHAAARVGGIAANSQFPLEYLSDNTRMQLNVMDAARSHGVDRFVFIASAACYPEGAVSPIAESALLSGPPPDNHSGYALAKLTGIRYTQLMRKAGSAWTSLIPTNIYGPRDNYHPEWSHVVPALLRRFLEAKQRGDEEVVIWGTGNARRELLHSADLGRAVVAVLEADDIPTDLNVGVGFDVSIAELATLIGTATGYAGQITFDSTRPDGIHQRLLDSSRLRDIGWQPRVDLADGLAESAEWLATHWDEARI